MTICVARVSEDRAPQHLRQRTRVRCTHPIVKAEGISALDSVLSAPFEFHLKYGDSVTKALFNPVVPCKRTAVPGGELRHRIEIAAAEPIDFRAAESRHSCQIVHVSPIRRFPFWTSRIYARKERFRKPFTTRARWHSMGNRWATSDFGWLNTIIFPASHARRLRC